MRPIVVLRAVAVAGFIAGGSMVLVPGAALATPLKVCVPEKENSPIKTPKASACPRNTN